jgi:error-prone DNA polymerase
MYTPLWVKSNGSFLEGASHPEELVEEAHHLGLRTIALTDREGVYGAVRAHLKAKELGLRLLLGAEVTIEEGERVILLAQDRVGWASLCTLLSIGRRRAAKGFCELSVRDLCEHATGLLALLAGDPIDQGGTFPSPLARQSLASLPPPRVTRASCQSGTFASRTPPRVTRASCQDAALALIDRPTPDSIVARLREVYGDRLYALVARHHRAEEVAAETRMRALARRHAIPIAATTEVLYHSRARRPLQDVLTCIRHRVSIHEAGRRLRANDEHTLLPDGAFHALFADDPAAVAATAEIAARCDFSLDQLRYRYPSEKLPSGQTSAEFLRERTYAGAAWRYGGPVPDEVRAQLDKELALIDELDYCGYFLTMVELVEFCRDHNILCQGRGSAANSAVCYCLGITAVDPVKMGLLFERFLSKERAEPPDIDLDFEHERREEAIQHLYQKHGRRYAAMVANVIRYRSRSALRDVGRALGIAETTLDRLAKLLAHYDGEWITIAAQAGLDPEAPVTRQLIELAEQLLEFPRHLSIHPGGFLLGHDPVSTIVPIENATMEDRTVIQWDKDDVEAIGLFKVDLLALGALTHLHKCFDLLKQHHDLELSMATVPSDDPLTYEMIRRGDTIGVFQIESRAQMSMLPRLRPKDYYDIVVQISIVRPGPISGGMVHPYLRRRNGQEKITYPHDILKPVLQRTLGVPLFQEQVMRIAVVAADYTPGEADQLRRDMAAWRRNGRIQQHRERLVTRMQKKGISPEFAEAIYKQICGFGEYGFPESHAASFALISYVGSYLRAHHPAIFVCGLLNSQPMGFYSPSTIVEDAKRHGVRILPIDALRSSWDCTMEGEAVRMGMRYVKSLPRVAADRLIAARTDHVEVDELAQRARLDARALRALTEAGAFETLRANSKTDRRQTLWQVHGVGRGEAIALPVEERSAPPLPTLSLHEEIVWDHARSSHSTRGHPLTELRPALRAQGLPDARAVGALPHGRHVRYAGLVICRQRPGTASGVTFMTLEDETGLVNVVVWQKVFERHAVLLKTQGFLGIEGRLQVQDGVTHLIADSLWKPQLDLEPYELPSHDFH